MHACALYGLPRQAIDAADTGEGPAGVPLPEFGDNGEVVDRALFDGVPVSAAPGSVAPCGDFIGD